MEHKTYNTKHITRNIKKITSFVVFALCFILFVAVFTNASAGFLPTQLVPCGTTTSLYSSACTPCHLWSLANNVINFIFYGLAIPILTVVLMWGGILMMTGGADAILEGKASAGNITRGKKMLLSGVVGIFIAAAGWLIVSTIINTFAAGKYTAGWARVECAAIIPSATSGITSTGTGAIIGLPVLTGVGSVDNKNSANALVTSGVTFDGNGSCSNENGQRVSAATNLSELQNGQAVTVCRNRCSTSNVFSCTTGGANLDPKVLSSLVLTKQGTGVNFIITSLSTGDHAPNSSHYQGKAVDLVPTTVTQANYTALRNQLGVLAGAGKRVACEDNSGNIVADCNTSQTTHIHASF